MGEYNKEEVLSREARRRRRRKMAEVREMINRAEPTPGEIREACRMEHAKTGAVLPPQYCPACRGCPIATIVIMLSGGPPPGQGWRPLEVGR